MFSFFTRKSLFHKALLFACCMVTTVAYAQVPTNGLVAYYPFNGNANDESGNGNNPTTNNATVTTDRFGNANKAYNFNGVDNWISFTTPPMTVIDNWTISAWVNPATLSQFSMAVNVGFDNGTGAPSCGYGFGMSNGGSGAVNGNVLIGKFGDVAWFNSGMSYNVPNTWYHIVISRASGITKYYMNGIQSSTTSSGTPLPPTKFTIGGEDGNGSGFRFWNGKIDDIAIYNRALSTTEVTQLYNAEAPPVTLQTGLVAYYPFNGNANDESGNGNNGVVNGATLTTDRFGNANKAYNFDGIDDVIQIANSTSLTMTNEISISAWVKISTSYNGVILNKGESATLGGNWDYGLTTYYSYPGYRSTAHDFIVNSCLNRNDRYEVWHLFTTTVNQSTNTTILYIDGAKIDGTIVNWQGQQSSGASMITQTANPLKIGKGHPNNIANDNFKGKIDDIRIYNRALSDVEVRQLYNSETNSITITQPQISLSTSNVALGQSMSIHGEGFNPFGAVYLNFFGATGQMRPTVTADINGKFTYTYTATPATTQAGSAAVRATDVIRQLQSSFKPFNITTPVVLPTSYLRLSAPTPGSSYEATRPINVSWSDIIVRKYGNYSYPMIPGSAQRMYAYKIEYQVGANAAWQTLTNVGGGALLNTNLSKTIPLVINTPNAACRVRVTDYFVNTIIATSEVFAVTPYTSNLQTSLEWDYSFPSMTNLPTLEGVAAEGTSRCYLKVAKKAGFAPNLVSATVTLSGNIAATPQYLGKLKSATNLSSYSTEADNATAITLQSNTIQNNAIWFWYVAPDDFSDNSADFNNAPQRIVQAQITATFSDGTSETYPQKITIVRPPLMMVHGLASKPAAFNNFQYDEGNTAVPFVNSPLLKQKKAITLIPNAAFATNANAILSPDCIGCNVESSNFNNTFQGNIAALRLQGFAANQVDYVCHSMGGCVLRTAMTVLGDKFYGRGSFSNQPYKSYGKGFVHKAITINTPHTGSPVADAITEYIPQASENVNIGLAALYAAYPGNLPLIDMSAWDFIKPTNPNTLGASGFMATDAVRNLQAVGQEGVNLGATAVKHHLITGDADLISSETANILASMDPYIKILDKALQVARDLAPNNTSEKTYLTGLMRLNQGLRVFTFIEWYSQQKGYPNFMGDGDLVVPLMSQFAADRLPATVPPNVSIFRTLSSNHLSIVGRRDVGNKVKDLLNTTINNTLFGDNLAATINSRNPNDIPLKEGSKSLLTTRYDTSKVVIDLPFRNQTVFVDSTLEIKFRLKDTARLAYLEYSFQNDGDFLFSVAPNQNVRLQIHPNWMGRQTIYVKAAYDNVTGTDFYIDTVSVNVQTTAALLKFQVSPEFAEINKGQFYNPAYQATYQTFIANVANNDNNISVVVNNPNIVSYHSTRRAFVGVDTGSTFATISYKGLTDTIYLNVLDTGSIVSGVNDFWNPSIDKSIAMQLYPNPTTGQFTLSLETMPVQNAQVTVFNLVGQAIFQQKFSGQTLNLDLSNQPQGVYLVRLRTENGAEATRKIQKW